MGWGHWALFWAAATAIAFAVLVASYYARLLARGASYLLLGLMAWSACAFAFCMLEVGLHALRYLA